ncbi:MAG: sugar phosphate nucleotidyltransferase [Oscillospiraceae bacterium]|nr:sugar phosphate nucleotidyltransferase [Oscillospiraceae bacterium]
MSEKISLFVPGRLCLFGEHSDWAGLQRLFNADIVPGASIVTGIEQGIYADVEKHDRFAVRNVSKELADGWSDFESAMQSGELKKTAASDNYFAYVAGVASYVFENYNVGGMKITITKMTLPVKSGLSSSAAICVLVARAFNHLYGLNMNTIGEMTVAFKGEQRTKSRCGRLDQACAFGISPVLMRFDGEDIDVKRLVVGQTLHFVFANLKGSKDTISILSDLNKCYPYAKGDIDKDVQSALGIENEKIVSKAALYIEQGDAKALGALMSEAQALFDAKVAPASPKELAAPLLHSVLADETVKLLTYGGKGVGSQGDGSVQFLAKDADCQSKLAEYLNNKGMTATTLTIKPRHHIHKAIIPVAGFGTRLYPATRAISKEFIPVVDSDGLVKPVILIILQQLYDSGIDEICLIVGEEEDIETYNRFLKNPLSQDHARKLPPQMAKYENKLLEIGKRVTFCVQKEKHGFGHAVYQSREFCGNEPVLLLLGDTIYRSNISKSCSEQLIESFDRIGRPIVAIHPIPVEDVVHYGILSGTWEDKSERVLSITNFVEKPTAQYARDCLGVASSGRDKRFFSVFGQYVLTPDVFSQLEANILEESETEKNGEYGLTDAIAALIDKGGVYGVVLDGEMFDTGNAQAYKRTMRLY